jgi:hypothetical protein
MKVTYDENGISSQQLVELIEDLGFEGTEWETGSEGREKTASMGERIVQIQFGGVANQYVHSTSRHLYLKHCFNTLAVRMLSY